MLKKLCFLIPSLIIAHCAAANDLTTASPLSLVIVDTYGQHAHAYRNTAALADSVGFTVNYKNLYGLIESPIMPNTDVAIIIVNNKMLRAPKHTLAAQWIKAVQNYVTQSNKSIVLLLPRRFTYTKENIQLVKELLESLGLFPARKSPLHKTLKTFLTSLKTEHAIGSMYGTSLLPAQPPITPAMRKVICTKDANKEIIARETPFNTARYSLKAQHTLPAGLLWRLPDNNTTVLVAPSHVFTFADLQEECMKVPVNIDDRNELLSIAQRMLQELYYAHTNQSLDALRACPVPLSNCFTESFIQQQKETHEKTVSTLPAHYQWIVQEGISCGWVDAYDFFGQEDPHQKLAKLMKKQLKKELGVNPQPTQVQAAIENYTLSNGLNFLYNASFNMWWLCFMPEYYLAADGKFADKKDEFIKKLTIVSNAIPKYAQTNNKEIPKIFIGLCLTSNFKDKKVKNPVYDVFGKEYPNIPCPFDWDNFWLPEAIAPFKQLCAVAKDLPIDGVFIDFEMYHAQTQANNFADIFDFSDLTWGIYCTASKNNQAKLSTVAHRVAYLAKEKKFNHYFIILEQRAEQLGKQLKKEFTAIKPNLLIACYAPTLPDSWFYRGLLRGLSSKQEPIIYATFNTDYYSHHAWLTAQRIHVLHGSVIMLSKFNNTQSFDLIPYTQAHHNFVWYNHPTRMVYGYNQSELNNGNWWGIEASPLGAQEVAQQITKQSSSNHSN